MGAASTTGPRIWLMALAAAAAGAALYAGTVTHGFVYDDINIVQKNPLARDPGALGAIFSSHYWANVTEEGNLYRPVTILSFALNHALTGPGPAGHHATNALLHGLVSGLAVLLAAALGLRAGPALAAGLLFAFHPVHVEAVDPVVGRSELLAALFGLAAWLCHLHAGRKEAPWRSLLAPAAGLLVGLAVLSKENAFVIPVLVWIGDRIRPAEPALRASRRASLAWMSAIAGALLLARAWILPGIEEVQELGAVFTGIGFYPRFLTAVGVLGRYLWLMLFPVDLSADYSYRQIPLITSPASLLFIGSFLVHLGLTAAAWMLASKGRLSGLALWIYLGALFPLSNIAFSIGTVMGERLLYLPSLGLCLLAPALYQEGCRENLPLGRRRLAALCVAAACSLYAMRVVDRSRDWKDQHTLFEATVVTSPLSAKAHYNLGVEEDERGRLEEAIRSYRRALEIKPDMTQAMRNLGLALLRSGKPGEAVEPLAAAARLDPDIPDLFSDLGIAYHRIGKSAEAEAAFREEIRRRPEAAGALFNLGTLLLDAGRPAEAVGPLRKARSLQPDNAEFAGRLGEALALAGLGAEAVEAYGAALALDPSMTGLLVPMARTAMGAGMTAEARRAARAARNAGIDLPADLRGLAR